MCALYAFSRHCDDLADQAAPADERTWQLEQWQESLSRALNGQFDHPLLPALADTVRRYNIPAGLLRDILHGVQMDARSSCRFASYAELQTYCYHVASAVGLACIHIWGYRDEAVFNPAQHCGMAFQMTNILRDLHEDIRRDRIYLPLDELQRFGYLPEHLASGVVNDRFHELLAFQIQRTERLYDEAAQTVSYLSRDGRRIFRLMWSTYRRLLTEIKRRQAELLSRRIGLPWRSKLSLVVEPWRPAWGPAASGQRSIY